MSEFGEPFTLFDHSRYCAINMPRTIQIEIRPNAHGDSEPLSREATDRIVAAVTDRLNALAGVDLANLTTIQQLALQVLTKPQEVTPLAMLVDEGQEQLAGQHPTPRDRAEEWVKARGRAPVWAAPTSSWDWYDGRYFQYRDSTGSLPYPLFAAMEQGRLAHTRHETREAAMAALSVGLEKLRELLTPTSAL